MKKSAYKFIYQSQLQRFYSNLSVVIGALVGMVPSVIVSPYTDYLFYECELSDSLIAAIAALIFVLGLGLMIVGMLVGIKIGKRFVSTGTLQFYSGYATLEYGCKTALLNKDQFSVVGFVRRGSHQRYWDIRFDGHKVCLNEAVKKFWLPRYDPSLGEAMMELLKSGLSTPSRMVSRALKEIEKKMEMTSSPSCERTFNIGDIVITKRISTPAVFAGSPYYVDYIDPFMPQDEPACGCYVREVADPEHVVAEIFFEDDKAHKTPKTESILSKSVILYGVVLDERIGLT